MPIPDSILRELREFNRYTGDGLPDEPVGADLPVGDPSSGTYHPKKSGLRQAIGETVEAAQVHADAAEAARIAAEAAASGVQSPKATVAAAQADDPASDPDFYLIAFYDTTQQPNSGARYKKAAVEPSHAGKFQNANGTWYELAERVVSPAMFGGSVSAALGYGGTVALDGAYSVASPIQVSAPHLALICRNGASLTFTGAAGANYVLELTNVDDLIIDGQLLIDCDLKAATGLSIRAAADADLVDISGVSVVDPLQSGAATYGADGIIISANTGRGKVARITGCRVENVSRSVAAGTCSGISVTDFLHITVSGNIIDGVYKGSGTTDADGIKVFQQLTSGDYDYGAIRVEGNIVANCEGRFVKAQHKGLCSISRNTFRFTEALDLITSAKPIDCQIDGGFVDDNIFELLTAWTGAADFIFCYFAAPDIAPTYTGQMITGSMRRNKVVVAAGAPDIRHLFYVNLDALATRGYVVNFDVEGNFATTSSGWGAASIGVFAGTITVPVTWAAGARANIRILGNDIDASNFLQRLPTSGGTAAHGGLGDLSDKLFLTIKGNKLPRTSHVEILPYNSNDCFTSSFVVAGNSIGIRANSWQPPFDFAKLLGGNEFYLNAATTPTHLNSPSSFTTSIVSRVGLQLLVDMYGGVKTNKTMSLTAIGATPSWT